jgi:hypothetical protein
MHPGEAGGRSCSRPCASSVPATFFVFKDLSLAALSKALARIGYRLRLVPAAGEKRMG